MGQITVFGKPDCHYCVKVRQLLKEMMDMVLKKNGNDDTDDLIGENSKRKEKKLTLQVVNCALDGSLAALCIRLTGSFTVPHVFFNESYVGDATAFCRMVDTPSGSDNAKGQSAGRQLEECPIFEKLKLLALKPDPEPPFPSK